VNVDCVRYWRPIGHRRTRSRRRLPVSASRLRAKVRATAAVDAAINRGSGVIFPTPNCAASKPQHRNSGCHGLPATSARNAARARVRLAPAAQRCRVLRPLVREVRGLVCKSCPRRLRGVSAGAVPAAGPARDTGRGRADLPNSGRWRYASPRHQVHDHSQPRSGWLRRLVTEGVAVSVQRLD
jgi:hypothetical protein